MTDGQSADRRNLRRREISRVHAAHSGKAEESLATSNDYEEDPNFPGIYGAARVADRLRPRQGDAYFKSLLEGEGADSSGLSCSTRRSRC